MVDGDLIDWLRESDPALRWQVELDLAGASSSAASRRVNRSHRGWTASPTGSARSTPCGARSTYFRMAAQFDGTPPDPRMAEAIELIRAARQPDGTWLQADHYPGRVWFDVDVPVGQPSKWLTLYATRVLAWWDSHNS